MSAILLNKRRRVAREGYESLVLSGGPTAYWRSKRLDGVVLDASGNGHNGTAQGGVTSVLPGAINRDPDPAMGFDGVDDHVDLGSPIALTSVVSKFSVVALFNADQLPVAGVFPHIICQRDASTSVWTLSLNGGAGDCVELAISSSGTRALARTDFAPEAGTWYLVAASYDDSGDRKPRIWINGVEGSYRIQQAMTGTIASSATTKLAIGNRIGSGRGWDGLLDEIAIYPRALTLPEITACYLIGRNGALALAA